MVLESLFNPFSVKKKPWEMFFAGFLYTSVSILLSFWFFGEIPKAASMSVLFLIVFSTLPLLYVTIKNEENLDAGTEMEWKVLKEHSKVLFFLIFLFLGITLALALAYIFLPQDFVNIIFSVQHEAANSSIQGSFDQAAFFSKLLLNNIIVLFFCVAFSFVYGTGAIFILTWNASVVAVAMGNLFRTEISKAAALVGSSTLTTYFSAATFTFWRYMTHGFLEMGAYFVAGLAGGIISVAFVKKDFGKKVVLLDIFVLLTVSFILLFVGALVEAYITPLLYV